MLKAYDVCYDNKFLDIVVGAPTGDMLIVAGDWNAS